VADDLDAQQAAMTVEVPDLPFEVIEDIAARIARAEQSVARAERTGELSPEWEALRTHLVDHYLHDDLDWSPWMDWDYGAWRQ
jgi:hypothetical protein